MDVTAPTLQQLYGVDSGGIRASPPAENLKSQVQQASHTIPAAGAEAEVGGMYAHQQHTYPQLPSPQQQEPVQVVYAGKPPPNYHEQNTRKETRSGRSSSSGGSRGKKKKKKRLIPSPLRPSKDNRVKYRVVVRSLPVNVEPKATSTEIYVVKENEVIIADDMTNVDNITRVHIVKPRYGWVSAFDQSGNNTIELNEQREYTLIFKRKPLGFKVLGDEIWHNAIVTTILDPNCGVVRGSLLCV
eukprot:TRINITY_DN4791_c0_g1_i1.p1 TRINITY_DN4791_c0_g1~~TRINITY_DN4791_c0_g1_i1.p1  ORF type:complete len:243 (+),score=30.80 TRINITY_DN4791_c0_g1_i1:95-823(+)